MTTEMDRRTLPGLAAGMSGFAFGVAGAALQSPSLAVISGSLALMAGANGIALVRNLQQTERRAQALEAAHSRHEEAGTGRGRSLLDRETGVPDGRFFELTLETRIAAARRHLWPITMVLVEARPPFGAPDASPSEWMMFTSLLQQTLREADVICRLTPTTFALLLEDTSEAGGVWAAERVQSSLAQASSLPAWRLTAGVASYPTHGLTAPEVCDQARAALARACSVEAAHGLGQVEVARSEIS